MPKTEADLVHAGGLLLFSEWLYQHIGTYKPDLIGYEAPLAGVTRPQIPKEGQRAFVMNESTIRILWGLVTLVVVTAKASRIDAAPVNVMTARKHLTGSGRPGATGDQSKIIVRDRLNSFGWGITSLDAADAACGWLYLKSARDKSFKVETGTPLFTQRRRA